MIAPKPNNLGEKQNSASLSKLSSQNLPRGYLSREDDEDDQINEDYSAKKNFH